MGGWNWGFTLHAYMPTEDIPDFTSTVYIFYGLEGECAPEDTTEVIFAPSVNTIEMMAFYECESLVQVTIPDTITRIEQHAFFGCHSLIFIRLSRNLEFMGL